MLLIVICGAFLCVIPTTFANEPKLSGSMSAFQLNPIDEINKKDRKDIIWKNADSNNVNLTDFKGKVILLNFWASWCLPCIRELPSIDRLQSKLGGKDFMVVAISLDRGGKKIATRLLKRLKINNLKLYIDRESKSARQLDVRVMPTTFIFDRKGRELGKLQKGAEWDDTNAFALVKFFIDNPTYADPKTKKND